MFSSLLAIAFTARHFLFFPAKSRKEILCKLGTLTESVDFTHSVRGGRILGYCLLNQTVFLLKTLVLLLLAKSKPISMKWNNCVMHVE